jgi:hypothetical protein
MPGSLHARVQGPVRRTLFLWQTPCAVAHRAAAVTAWAPPMPAGRQSPVPQRVPHAPPRRGQHTARKRPTSKPPQRHHQRSSNLEPNPDIHHVRRWAFYNADFLSVRWERSTATIRLGPTQVHAKLLHYNKVLQQKSSILDLASFVELAVRDFNYVNTATAFKRLAWLFARTGKHGMDAAADVQWVKLTSVSDSQGAAGARATANLWGQMPCTGAVSAETALE